MKGTHYRSPRLCILYIWTTAKQKVVVLGTCSPSKGVVQLLKAESEIRRGKPDGTLQDESRNAMLVGKSLSSHVMLMMMMMFITIFAGD